MNDSYKTKVKDLIDDYLKKHINVRFTAKEMYDDISKLEKVNLTTIYRNLDKLVESGTLLKHQDMENKCSSYQYIENVDCLLHFHFECRKCGKMIHLGKKETNDFLRMIQKNLFFTVEPQNTYLTGLCNDCRGKLISFDYLGR